MRKEADSKALRQWY